MMAEYRIRETGEVVSNLGPAFPNASIPREPSPADMEVLGVDLVAETVPPQATENQRAIREGIEADGAGGWRQKWTLIAYTPPRRELPKSTVYGRLKAMGKVPALLEIFAAQPQIAYEWNMPGWPNVFADDEQLLAALGAIGCTAEQIATITAPT